MKNILLTFCSLLSLTFAFTALGSTIQLNCVYRVDKETSKKRELLKEISPFKAQFSDGTYIVERPVYVDALGTCVERAQALSIAHRKEYFVAGIEGYSLGKLCNGFYYPVFYGDHKVPAKDGEIEKDHPGYLEGKCRQTAADTLFSKSLLLTKKCENEDTFSQGYIPFKEGKLAKVDSVEDVVTDRTLQDVRRFDVFFDVEDNGKFYTRYEYYLNPQGVRMVTQDEKDHSEDGAQYILPSHLFQDVLSKRENLGKEQLAALIQQLRFALDTRYRTQEFESYSLVFACLEGFRPEKGQVMPFTDGARRHNLVLKGDRLILHTEMEYMLNHFEDESKLGTLVTVRAERIMVFDLKRLHSTPEHLFLKRIAPNG